jgi:hypothetical protein
MNLQVSTPQGHTINPNEVSFEDFFPKDDIHINSFNPRVADARELFDERREEYFGRPQKVFEEYINPKDTFIDKINPFSGVSASEADRKGFGLTRNFLPALQIESIIPQEEVDPNKKSDIVIEHTPGGGCSNGQCSVGGETFEVARFSVDPNVASQRMLEVVCIAEAADLNLGTVGSLYYTPTVQKEETFEARADALLKMADTFKALGIEAEFRLPPNMLDKLYQDALIFQQNKNNPNFDPAQYGKIGVAILVKPKDEADHMGHS